VVGVVHVDGGFDDPATLFLQVGGFVIELDNVHKRYLTDHGPGPWVLQGVNLTIPPKTNVGLIGCNGAGKSTLLRLIGGIDQPNKGRIQRHCHVSWPLGSGGGLKGSMTGKQNAKFVSRLYVDESSIPDRIRYIESFADIGEAFNAPVHTYSSGMKSRLLFAMSLAFDFDVYISDEVTSAGDASFHAKASQAFVDLAGRAGLIMVSHSDTTLKRFCQSGIWLHRGQAHWFDNIDDALSAYHQSIAA
jgi:capsular polysaccharide transport system ATP-binding protein